MRFHTIVVKNLLHRPVRSALTVSGIAIGIAAVVALTSVAWGFEEAWVQIYAARGTDLIVTRAGGLNPVAAPFPYQAVEDLRALPGVAQGSGVLSDVIGIEHVPVVLIFAWEADAFLWDHLRLVEGRLPADGAEPAVVLGAVAADALGKTVGAPIRIQHATFTVSGVFESASLTENGAVVMTLPQLQRVTGHTGKVNFVNVKLARGATDADAAALRDAINTRWPDFRAFLAGDVGDHNAALRMVEAMSRAATAIAFAAGAVGVANTVLMSVFERVREIGLLLAVGWQRRWIVGMILCESVVLSLAGGVLGLATGLGAVELLEATPLLEGKIEGAAGVPLLAVALAVAGALGVAGGAYPAYRASCLRPAEALRYE